MKKSIKIIAIALVAVMLCLSLASCAKRLDGKYEAEVDLSILGKFTYVYTFDGKDVTLLVTKSGAFISDDKTTYTGTYEINELDNGDMEITFEFENEDDRVKSGTVSFEEGEGYVKINGVTYNLVEE